MLDQIQSDLKEAQIAHDEVKVSTLRLLLAEIKNEEIKKGEQLSDPDMVSMVQREVKKRREAAEGFRSGGREESAKVEEQELEVLQSYLPEQLSNEELTKMVEEAINELGANSISDMGKVIGLVMGKVAGKAEGGAVSSIVKQKLNG
jgi:uncharacterized protein